MAFYGRITNNQANTAMNFDKVFPNRVTMDATASSDGIFTGRFVLVEYSTPDEALIPSYINTTYDENNNPIYDETEVYQANYQKDQQKYTKLGRGYDSTVWRKVIAEDGTGYYVMLAELNSVVPSFTVEAEAPSANAVVSPDTGEIKYLPVKPYFSEDSTNVFYNLHVGTPWGLKMGTMDIHQSGFDKYTIPQTEVAGTLNNKIVMTAEPSGEKYRNQNGTLEPADDQQRFDVYLPTIGDAVREVWDRLYGGPAANAVLVDEDATYDANTTYYKLENQRLVPIKGVPEEIQAEWAQRKAEGTLYVSGTVRNTDVGWYGPGAPKARSGVRLVHDTSGEELLYTPHQLDNAAAAINSMCDLIGMNVYVISDEDLENNGNATDTNGIYYNESTGKFYYKDYAYEYQELDPSDPDDLAIINEGSKFDQFNGTLLDPADLDLYRKPGANSEHYLRVEEHEDLQPSVEYYLIDHLDEFEDPNATSVSTDEDFMTLVTKESLFKKSIDGQRTVLTPATVEDEPVADLYFTLADIEPQNNIIYFPGSNTSAFHFYRKDSRRLDSYPTNEKIVLYQTIRSNEQSHPIDEQGNIDYSRIIYTTTLEPVAITRELADDPTTLNQLIEDGDAIPNLPVVNPWPNASGVTITTPNAIWYKENNNYILSPNPPRFSSLSDCLSGMTTIQLTATPANNFYQANTVYWGVIDHELDLDDPRNAGLTNKRADEVYRKTTAVNDKNPTYKLEDTYNASTHQLISIEISHYPAVNGLDGEMGTASQQFYFIPNELYKRSGNEYVLADTLEENVTYYKRREVVVQSDPLGEFNVGEIWNTKLNINDVNSGRGANEKVVLAIKIANPDLFELPGYSRDINTINGWILFLNRLLGIPGDADTRDRTKVQGLINYLNDRLDKIENVGKNQLLVSDKYGHINGATLNNATSQWVEATVTHTSTIPTFTLSHKTNEFANVEANRNAFGATLVGDDIQFTFPVIDNAGHVVGKTNPTAESGATAFTLPFGYKTISGTSGTATASNTADTIAVTGDNWLSTAASANSLVISHIGPVTVTARSESDVTPSFGGTFTIEDWAFDDKGHKSALSTHTVSIPKGSLTTSTGVSGDVITDLAFTDTTGALVISGRSNIGALTLSGYTAGTSTASVEATDTLNAAISKLQKQIDAHVSADEVTSFSTTATTSVSNVVSSLTLSDGNLAATTISAGDLLLTGYSLPSEPSAVQIGIYESPIVETDSIGQAFAKLQYQINANVDTVSGLSSVYDALGAAEEVLGTDEDTYEDDTVFGAKAYADHQIENIEIEYTTQTANPDYDPEDPTSQEFIETTSTMSLSGLLAYVQQLETRLKALEPAEEPTPDPEEPIQEPGE